MARNGSGVYSLPAGYLAVTGADIEAATHNDPLEDIEADMNTARPVVAGGTGADNAGDARTNLGLDKISDSGIENSVVFFDDGDATKKWAIELSGITTATTRTWTVPDATDTFVGLATTQTLTNKTISGTYLAGSPVTNNGSMYATYGGTADVVTLTTGATLTALTAGQEFRFRATAANTGATTINVDAIGAVTAKTPTGAALPASFIRTDVDTVCRYDGTDMIVSRAIERGSDSNGHFIRYEDGTLQCYENRLILTQAAVGRCQVTWTFPAAFSDAVIALSATLRTQASGDSVNAFDDYSDGPGADEIGATAYGNITTTTVDIAVWRANGKTDFGASGQMYAGVSAIGKWY